MNVLRAIVQKLKIYVNFITTRKRSCGQVMVSQVSVHSGVYPSMHLGSRGLSQHALGQAVCGQGVWTEGVWMGVNTPRDGY